MKKYLFTVVAVACLLAPSASFAYGQRVRELYYELLGATKAVQSQLAAFGSRTSVMLRMGSYGPDWYRGNEVNLPWSSSGISNAVTVNLRLKGVTDTKASFDIASDLPITAKTYKWSIPDTIPDGTYWVQICAPNIQYCSTGGVGVRVKTKPAQAQAKPDISTPAVKIIKDIKFSKDGKWDAGTNQNISWTALEVTSADKFSVELKGKDNYKIADKISGRAYNWKSVGVVSGKWISGDYEIQVCVSGTAVCATGRVSIAPKVFTSTPVISVFPTVARNQTGNLVWVMIWPPSYGEVPKMKAEVISGKTSYLVAENVSGKFQLNSGNRYTYSYAWKYLGQDINGKDIPDGTYSLKVCAMNGLSCAQKGRLKIATAKVAPVVTQPAGKMIKAINSSVNLSLRSMSVISWTTSGVTSADRYTVELKGAKNYMLSDNVAGSKYSQVTFYWSNGKVVGKDKPVVGSYDLTVCIKGTTSCASIKVNVLN